MIVFSNIEKEVLHLQVSSIPDGIHAMRLTWLLQFCYNGIWPVSLQWKMTFDAKDQGSQTQI